MILGWLPTSARLITPKVLCMSVCAYSALSRTCANASFFRTMTMRMPSRSLSSRRSLMPSMVPARTRPAIFSISAALFTWYGSSLTMIWARPCSTSSISLRARTMTRPRPVVT